MEILSISIENFKGVRKASIDFGKEPRGRVYTMVGINESGKTTILEAINSFAYNRDTKASAISSTTVVEPNDMVPIKDKTNFNDAVTIEMELLISEEERKKLKAFAKNDLQLLIEVPETFSIVKKYKFKNSNYENGEKNWVFDLIGRKSRGKVDRTIEGDDRDKCISFLKQFIPKILYFPTALFDLPDRIYLTDVANEKNNFYIEIVQDILDAMKKDLNIQEHIVERFNNPVENNREALKQLRLDLGREITKTVLDNWSAVLSNKRYEVVAEIERDEKGIYLELNVATEDGSYKLSERSLGFRWFFVFQLLTQYRGFRQNEQTQVMFLFDEPAANLSTKAQRQLLKSLANISDKCSIIYTTHSQHLINPDWLENAFVVSNKALEKEYDEYDANLTDISIERYREFVNKNPQQTSYFQPILDVLEYAPSRLEMVNNALIVEGKNDYFALRYFLEVILGKKEIDIIPGMGCNNVSTLISLYIGWGKRFVVLLDADKDGESSKKSYIESFGNSISENIITLADVDCSWKGKNLETILSESAKVLVQKKAYLQEDDFSKKKYNRAIQELLARREICQLDERTRGVFTKIYNYIAEKCR